MMETALSSVSTTSTSSVSDLLNSAFLMETTSRRNNACHKAMFLGNIILEGHLRKDNVRNEDCRWWQSSFAFSPHNALKTSTSAAASTVTLMFKSFITVVPARRSSPARLQFLHKERTKLSKLTWQQTSFTKECLTT